MLYKSADNKQPRLKFLKNFLETRQLNASQKNWLVSEIHKLKTGIQGEQDAAYYIDNAYDDSNFLILHDLRFEIDDQIVQIDHLAIGRIFILLFESKNFNGDISINEYGEFTVHYPNAAPYGIASPLEQSNRHKRLLAKLLDDIDLHMLTHRTHEIHNAVLFSPQSIITRPDSKKFDTSNIIKADTIASWRKQFGEKEVGMGLMRLITNGADLFATEKRLEKWAGQLMACHTPENAFRLPEFIRNAPLKIASQLSSASPPIIAQTISTTAPIVTPQCDTCHTPISEAEAKYCQARPNQFQGKLFCRKHQQSHLAKATPCCAEPNCGKPLSAREKQYCENHSQQFNGQFYCYKHQPTRTNKAA